VAQHVNQYFFKLISHKHIRSIEIIVSYMRNIKSISINIINGLDILLLLLLDIGLGEFDNFLTFSVHTRVVLITFL
jgi:hypothetical protein